MSATEQEHLCSCGRGFAHEVSLKRHRWVTGHAGIETAVPTAARIAVAAPVSAPTSTPESEETCRQAVALLIQKRFEYEAEVERQRKLALRQAIVQNFIAFLQEGLLGLGQAAQSGGRSAVSALSSLTNVALRLAFVLALSLGLVFAGMGVGRVIAIQADAQPSVSVAVR